MNNWISAIAALVLAYAAGADWRGEMPEDWVALRPNERTASVYHSYEFELIADTPPPDGFKPFYISHYGRHGSRYLTGSAVPDVMSALEKANKRNALTETGRSLLADMRKIAAVHDDMKGQLAERGAWELQRLARRMAERFPDVIKPIFQTENQYPSRLIPGLYREILYPAPEQIPVVNEHENKQHKRGYGVSGRENSHVVEPRFTEQSDEYSD